MSLTVPPTLDDDDEDEIDAADLQKLKCEVPLARNWSTPTFACHRHVATCLMACCCPCVQFGFNQRAAFGASCLKWVLLWIGCGAI